MSHDARRSRALLVVALRVIALAAFLSACASLFGVEEATLDPDALGPDATVDASVIDAAVAAPDACSGAGCACQADLDCIDAKYKRCVEGRCAECTTSPDSCSTGRFCLPGGAGSDAGAALVNECAPGCTSDDSCKAISPSAPFCALARHQCVSCRGKADCPKENQDCSPSGICADKCTTEGGQCDNGTLHCCSGFCIDVTKDIFNCNACGIACPGSDALCCDGTCSSRLGSVTTCGGCGVACSTANGTPSCTAGSCKWGCNAGFAHCADVTANSGCETSVADNPTQCGSCTNNCGAAVLNATGVACSGTQCTFATCNDGFASCDGLGTNGCECACGNRDQTCCPGNRCAGGDGCVGNVCQGCGRSGSACCPGGGCEPDNRCSGGRCRACTQPGNGCRGNGECCSNDCSHGRCR